MTRFLNEGSQARIRGWAIWKNPYQKKTPQWKSWRDGWLREDACRSCQ